MESVSPGLPSLATASVSHTGANNTEILHHHSRYIPRPHPTPVPTMQRLKRIPRTVSNAHQYRRSARAMSSTTVPSMNDEDSTAAHSSRTNTHRSGWVRYQTIVVPTVPTTTLTGALRFPCTRSIQVGVSRSYFSTKKDEDKEQGDTKKSSGGGPRLEARFGKLGAFVDRLTDEVGEELKKNKDIFWK